MKIWSKKLVSLLDTILPTYDENSEEELKVPCITYRSGSNVPVAEGDDLRYSNGYYRIKLHVKDLGDAEDYLQQIDTLMYMNRFFRESCDEIKIGDVHQFTITYRVMTRERILNYA